MNKNIKNMCKELKREFRSEYGMGNNLFIDAVDLTDCYNDDDNFDETMLDKLKIYYLDNTIVIKRYDCGGDNWEIEDEDHLRFIDFEKIGKILSIVMKHLGRIELIWFATII